MKPLVNFLIFSFLFTGHLFGQEIKTQRDSSQYLNVFIDCTHCDVHYFSEYFTLGTMVNDPLSADVHVHMMALTQPSGAILSTFIIIGKNRFKNLTDTLSFNIPAEASMDEKRNIQLDKLNMGLVPFILKTSQADRIFLVINDEEINHKTTKDPWRNWVFDIYGMGSLSRKKTYFDKNLNFSLNINRITKKNKIESLSHINYNESGIIYFDPDSNKHEIITCFKGFSSQNIMVKSLGNHFGIGAMAHILNDHTSNINLRYRVGPAIEFNVYPYHKSLQKQFRFLYLLAYEQSNYYDLTIYNRLNDYGVKQSFSIMAQYNQPWGYIDAQVTVSNYLHNISMYSVSSNFMASIRIPKIKGMSVNFSCSLSMYRDRINQAKGYATLEDLFTRQKEMETDFWHNLSFGISFRFGSKSYPPANPRFSH